LLKPRRTLFNACSSASIWAVNRARISSLPRSQGTCAVRRRMPCDAPSFFRGQLDRNGDKAGEAGRCAQISHLARAPAISLRNGHSGGEGLHGRRPALLPQADGSGRFYHSGLRQGESRQAFSRVPLRAGQPRAITIGFPFGVGALSSLNTGFGDLEIWWPRFRRKKPAPFFHERSTACRSPWIR
jgi:hypothetical protein